MSEQNIDRLFERQKQAPTLSEYRRIQVSVSGTTHDGIGTKPASDKSPPFSSGVPVKAFSGSKRGLPYSEIVAHTVLPV